MLTKREAKSVLYSASQVYKGKIFTSAHMSHRFYDHEISVEASSCGRFTEKTIYKYQCAFCNASVTFIDSDVEERKCIYDAHEKCTVTKEELEIKDIIE